LYLKGAQPKTWLSIFDISDDQQGVMAQTANIPFSAEDSTKIFNRLRALGYLAVILQKKVDGCAEKGSYPRKFCVEVLSRRGESASNSFEGDWDETTSDQAGAG
jgi:hypothetical protein